MNTSIGFEDTCIAAIRIFCCKRQIDKDTFPFRCRLSTLSVCVQKLRACSIKFNISFFNIGPVSWYEHGQSKLQSEFKMKKRSTQNSKTIQWVSTFWLKLQNVQASKLHLFFSKSIVFPHEILYLMYDVRWWCSLQYTNRVHSSSGSSSNSSSQHTKNKLVIGSIQMGVPPYKFVLYTFCICASQLVLVVFGVTHSQVSASVSLSQSASVCSCACRSPFQMN